MKIDAGEAMGVAETGGSIEISAGAGSNRMEGKGGSVRIHGGHSNGILKISDFNDGGDVQIVSGSANKGVSGSVLVQSGLSEEASSGAIGELSFFCRALKVSLFSVEIQQAHTHSRPSSTS